MLAVTATERVERNTDPEVNEKIRRATEMSVAFHAARPELVPARLDELDREWDIERALETMSASVTLAGLSLGLLRSRRWLILPLMVQSFFLQHALEGWCPPLPLLRRLGFRTRREIERERQALHALRGEEKAVLGEAELKRAVRAVESVRN
jgi:hypothetical protein